jgi:hypothetical protein
LNPVLPFIAPNKLLIIQSIQKEPALSFMGQIIRTVVYRATSDLIRLDFKANFSKNTIIILANYLSSVADFMSLLHHSFSVFGLREAAIVRA